MHAQRADFLGADVADKDGRALWGEAAPQSNGAKVATEIRQADGFFGLGVSNFEPTEDWSIEKVLSK